MKVWAYVFLAAVVTGMFCAWVKKAALLQEVAARRGLNDRKRQEREWEVFSKWYPIGEYFEHLTILTVMALLGSRPGTLLLLTYIRFYLGERTITKTCRETLHRKENQRCLKKQERNAPDTVKAWEDLSEKVAEDAHPVYRKYAKTCVHLTAFFVATWLTFFA